MKRSGAVLWAILLLSAEAAQKFPEYPVRSASEYSSCQTKNGITVAIEPVGDGEKQKKYFGAKFESQGFLPVLVVLENASKGSSMLLRKDLVTYGIDGDQSRSAAGEFSARSKSGEAVAVAGFAAISVPAMVIGLKLIAAASEVKQNILVKELRSQTIAPGKSGSGFLYVPVGKPGIGKRKVILNIPLSLDDSQETLVFTFDMEIPGGG
jgi:hypothetical protein